VSPPFAHVGGMPVEESLAALAPAGTATICVLALVAKAKIAELVAWLKRH
jgi:hypothetical protein